MRHLFNNSQIGIQHHLAESNAVKLSQLRYENVRVLNQVKEYEKTIKNLNDNLFLIMNYPQQFTDLFNQKETEKLEYF